MGLFSLLKRLLAGSSTRRLNNADRQTVNMASRLTKAKDASLTSTSSNRRHCAVALEGNGSSEGVVMLRTDGDIAWRLSAPRPNNTTVGNFGRVAFENWGGFDSPTTKCELFIVDPDGNVAFAQDYEANSRKSGLSDDGNLAWITTARSTSGDSNRLYVYDVEKEETLVDAPLPQVGVEEVRRGQTANEIIVTIMGEELSFRDGTLKDDSHENKDALEWKREERQIASPTSPAILADAAKSRLERIDRLSEKQIRDTLDALNSYDGSGNDRGWAKYHRRYGELCLKLGRKQEALQRFNQALDLYPKVGVKRKRKALRKELSSDGD